MIKLIKYRTHYKYTSESDKELRLFEKNMRVFIEGAVFSSTYREKKWDGYMNFVDKKLGTFSTGMIDVALDVMESLKINHSVKNMVPVFEVKDDMFNPKTYQHQRDAIVEFFKNFHGIIKVPTRGGKTILSAECVRLLQPEFPDLVTLFVVDTQMLLNQAVNDYSEYWGVDKGQIGVIHGDIFNPRSFTVTTIQTLRSRLVGVMTRLKKKEEEFGFAELKQKRKEVKTERNKYLQFFQSVDFLIVDECHEYTSDKRISLIKRFKNLSMDMFLSATPFKSQDMIRNYKLKMFAGDVIYEIKAETLKERGILARDKTFLFDIDHNVNKNIDAETFQTLQKQIITHNHFRNQVLLNAIEILRKLDIKTLVLFQDIKHGEYIQSITMDPFVHGKMKLDTRTIFTNEFLSKKGSVLLASDVFKKGITLPEVQVTINAAGGLEQSLITQKKGRGLGTTETKKKALSIDFVDNYKKYFYQHSLSRIQEYEESVGMSNIEVFDTSDNDMWNDFRDLIIEWFEIKK